MFCTCLSERFICTVCFVPVYTVLSLFVLCFVPVYTERFICTVLSLYCVLFPVRTVLSLIILSVLFVLSICFCFGPDCTEYFVSCNECFVRFVLSVLSLFVFSVLSLFVMCFVLFVLVF